jgi:hypothetical protein
MPKGRSALIPTVRYCDPQVVDFERVKIQPTNGGGYYGHDLPSRGRPKIECHPLDR